MSSLAYEALLPRILPQTLPCPASMALDAVQIMAVEFFRESGVWVEAFHEPVGDGRARLLVPKNAVVAGVYGLAVNGEKTSAYALEGNELELGAGDGACVAGYMTLRPKRTALEMPADLLEEYGDYLAYGAIARLKGMSGNKVEWNDPQGSQYYYGLYQDGLIRARQRKYRKRFGGQLLYVQTAEME